MEKDFVIRLTSRRSDGSCHAEVTGPGSVDDMKTMCRGMILSMVTIIKDKALAVRRDIAEKEPEKHARMLAAGTEDDYLNSDIYNAARTLELQAHEIAEAALHKLDDKKRRGVEGMTLMQYMQHQIAIDRIIDKSKEAAGNE